MGLQPDGAVEEAGFVFDLAGNAWQVGDFVGNLVPDAVVLICRGLLVRRAFLEALNQRVQFDHDSMVVQFLHSDLAGNLRGERGDVGVKGALRHCESGRLRLRVGYGTQLV